eukprot:TRINITY_DN7188_c0_g1_i1.p3 TRINITY_DN7188_c0_g1~~TRINITY_DN7188_c0_g1_i1.p3  ORF type:complete len:128 (+),score=32.59 TRINITY_DN7188_c0_g1_i1:43-384(+)
MSVILAYTVGIAGAAFGGRVLQLMWRARVARRSGVSVDKASAVLYGKYKGGFSPEITRTEAAQILNVQSGSDPKVIKKAHRTLMMLNHPDRGGSKYLATKVNEAKSFLLTGKS